MNLEQLPPNKPNFLLVVALFVVGILVVVVAGLLVARHTAKQEPSGHPAGNTKSMLRYDRGLGMDA